MDYKFMQNKMQTFITKAAKYVELKWLSFQKYWGEVNY